MDIDERRKNKRIELDATLIVNRLDSNNKKEINIDVIDISKSGIGFYSKDALFIGSVYDCDLTLWTKEVIHAFIEIVRIKREADRIMYGGIFIGMPDNDLKRIEVYETVQQYTEEE